MTARRHKEQFAPTVRSEGPPGVDWTQVQPECPACWRAWLEGGLPTDPLLSRRTHAAVVAAALALSSTAPTVVLAAGHPDHRGHAGLHDSDPGDAGVGLPVADSPSAPAAPEPDPPDADPEGPDPGTSETPPPPVSDESGPDAPGESGPAPEPPASGDENPAPQAPADPPTDQTPPAPPSSPPSAATAGPATPAVPQRMRSEQHIVIKGVSARLHRSSGLIPRKSHSPQLRAASQPAPWCSALRTRSHGRVEPSPATGPMSCVPESRSGRSRATWSAVEPRALTPGRRGRAPLGAQPRSDRHRRPDLLPHRNAPAAALKLRRRAGRPDVRSPPSPGSLSAIRSARGRTERHGRTGEHRTCVQRQGSTASEPATTARRLRIRRNRSIPGPFDRGAGPIGTRAPELELGGRGLGRMSDLVHPSGHP